MSARVIRVDWSAWATSEASSRRACGPKAFVIATAMAPLSGGSRWPSMLRVPDDEEDEPTPVPALSQSPAAAPTGDPTMLPGMADWLSRQVPR
jgi:hypothetical protein